MLSVSHQTVLLQDSAISPEVIKDRGYCSIEDTTELISMGFIPAHRRPGLFIPVHFTDGGNGLYQLRFDNEEC